MKYRLIFATVLLALVACNGAAYPTPGADPDPKTKEDVLELSTDMVTSSFQGETSTVTITSNIQPTATCNEGWCHVKMGSKGRNANCELTVFPFFNESGSERRAMITVKCGSISKYIDVVQSAFKCDIAETEEVSPAEHFKALGFGWNLGNHMDAINNNVASETAWGNAKCTQATMDAVKAAGIKTVRIPVSWTGNMGPAPTYTVSDAWMNRVAEIAGYAKKAGLNAIINIHHDGSTSCWLNIKSTGDAQEAMCNQFAQLWHQIAEKFKDEGDWLIFEPFNELQDGGWGWGENRRDGGAQYRLINRLNDIFVKAVRSTGGNNATRWLAACGYSNNAELTMENLVIPADYVTHNRQMISAHNYNPTDYTLETKYSQWGHTADPAKSCDNGKGEENFQYDFKALKEKYIDAGYPVYLGEMGCSFRANEPDISFHKYYCEYVCKAAHEAGITCIVWDNGSTGTGRESHGYFNHGTGAFIRYSEDVIKAMVKGATSEDPEYTLQSVYDRAPVVNR